MNTPIQSQNISNKKNSINNSANFPMNESFGATNSINSFYPKSANTFDTSFNNNGSINGGNKNMEQNFPADTNKANFSNFNSFNQSPIVPNTNFPINKPNFNRNNNNNNNNNINNNNNNNNNNNIINNNNNNNMGNNHNNFNNNRGQNFNKFSNNNTNPMMNIKFPENFAKMGKLA